MINPLIPDILRLLHQHPEGITEYLIIKSLEQHAGFAGISDDYQLAIFQKHFMVMNALYRLQKQLLEEEQLRLEISPLRIQLVIAAARANSQQPSTANDAKLSSYYLDWGNFENTGTDEVETLLNNFWTLYISKDKYQAALAVLDLQADADSETINRRYRELAATHHPDKGGDAATFILIRQAYETLCPAK